MSRAFVKEDDGEVSDFLSNERDRENKIEWLKIQEAKLERLIAEADKNTSKKAMIEKWIRDITEDIEKTKKELGYQP